MEEKEVSQFNNMEFSNIDKKTFDILLDNLYYNLKLNFRFINEANVIDLRHFKKKITLENIKIIIDEMRSRTLSNINERNVYFINGDTYQLIYILINSILRSEKVFVVCSKDFLFGTNEIVYNIFKRLYNDFDIGYMINLVYKIDLDEIRNLRYNEIRVISYSNEYNFMESKLKHVKFYPCNNLIMFSDSSEELRKLQKAIFVYSTENNYEIEVLNGVDYKDAVKYINTDKYKDIAVLLTRNKDYIEDFTKRIKDKKIFVNENPFKEDYKEVFKI